MLPLRAVALLFLCATPSLSTQTRPARSAGFHHSSSYGSEYHSSGFGGQGLASEPVVQTKASYKGCSSSAGCAGITLENGKITEKFGNPAAIGLNGEVSENIDPAELHKKFALQAADINSAFAKGIPASAPFWWAGKDSPFKDTYETYLKFVKENPFGAEPFKSPCGTPSCPFGSSFTSQKVSSDGAANSIDIANNPFLNGQFAAGFGAGAAGFAAGSSSSGFGAGSSSLGFGAGGSAIDISKNPFLNGNINLAGGQSQGGGSHGAVNSFTSSSTFGSSTGGAGAFGGSGINIGSNPFLNGAISGSGCSGGKPGGCSQSSIASFQQTGTVSKPSTSGGFDILNINTNPFLNGEINKGSGGLIHISGSSSTGGCDGKSCGGNKPSSGFEHQVTTGFGSGCSGASCGFQSQDKQQFNTGFLQGTTGCGGAGCGAQGQQQVTTGFGQGGATGCGGAGCGAQGQQQITTGFGQEATNGCSGAGCGNQGQQQITTSFQQVGCSGPFCGQDQQVQQQFPQQPKKPSVSNLPHPPGVAGAGFKESGNINGELSITCIGEGNICVHKNLCLNGFVNDNGENILQLRSAVRCRLSTEVCCKLKPKTAQTTSQTFTTNYQSTAGQKIDSASHLTTGSGLIHVPGKDYSQNVASHVNTGLIHVPGTPGETAFGQTGFDQTVYQGFNQINGKPSNEVRPPFTSPGQSGLFKDSVISQTQQQVFTKPTFGNVKKPGIPYLPPDDESVTPYVYTEPQNPYNPETTPTPYKPAPFPTLPASKPTPYVPKPTPYVPKPTPYVPAISKPTPYVPKPNPYEPQPTPYVPKPTPYVPKPTPYVPPVSKPTPYVPKPNPYEPQPTPYVPQPTPYVPKPTPYVPPVSRPTPYVPKPTPYVPRPTPSRPVVTGPGYLPPVDDESAQSSFGSQQIIKGPEDTEGGIILDETRNLPPKDNPIPIIPSGCAAALKCTPREFCTAEGVISNSTVILTKEQEEFRVPLTDCKEPSTGAVGKCCRDPTYTDPWPTNQLGQWIPGAFGDTGAYKADQGRGKPNRGPNVSVNPPNNDNRRQFGTNGLGLNPAGSINNPIYAANPNQIPSLRPQNPYSSNPSKPINPSVQLKNPVNAAAYPNHQQNNQGNPNLPTGSQVNPGKQVYASNPISGSNYPKVPTGTAGTPDSPPVSQVNTENLYTTGGLLLGNYQNNGKDQKQTQGTCGVRKGGTRPFGNKNEFEADFGEIPWQAMVLLQTNRTLLCGGVITSENVVVTSAHCVDGLEAKNVLVKGGEWKLGIDEEPRPFQIVQVAKIHKHPQYFTGSLQNDFAVLVLSENLRLAPHIAPICLPPANEDANVRLYQGGGRYKCITTGWGKQVLQVNIPNSIIHTMDMSLISPPQCQAQIAQNYPHLLENYNSNTCICGQPAQQSANVCRVDIGSALACTNGDGTYYMEGVYSWDSGCQSSNQLAAFYKIDQFWYQSVFEGSNYQASLYTQQQRVGGGALLSGGALQASNQQQQLGGYSTQIKQTVTKHGQSYAVSGQKQFQQAINGDHVHTGAQCRCYEEGKK